MLFNEIMKEKMEEFNEIIVEKEAKRKSLTHKELNELNEIIINEHTEAKQKPVTIKTGYKEGIIRIWQKMAEY